MTNQKALQILFQAYWDSNGWKSEKCVSPENFEYAKANGYMFDDVSLSHDEIVDWLKRSFSNVQLENVSNAFLMSLSTRRLELRSALGSFAVAKNFPQHKIVGEKRCEICGVYDSTKATEDLNVLNFERFKWGGVRHDSAEYIAFDLERFSEIEQEKPYEQDISLLKQILEVADNLPPDAKNRDLEKALAKILKSNKAERETLIQILGYCGILQPKNKPSYFDSFVNDTDRELPPAHKIDWSYPVCWWRGSDGVNKEAIAYYFSQLQL